MSIRIEPAMCIGCGRCADVCPGNLLRLDEAPKAVMLHPQDCWGCTACLKECPTGALQYFLGADLGGQGSTLSVRESGGISHWRITRPDGTVLALDVNKKDPNQY
ncbi:MAG: ferredoxin family protein [Faecalibacterium sp.]